MDSDIGGSWNCPAPFHGGPDYISLAHGEGGRLSRELIRDRILPALGTSARSELSDAATLEWHDCGIPGSSLAFTTDGYTVSPLFFPGGDIGRLAVFGTANDLAVAGAVPRWLSLGLILEEGLPWNTLQQVLESVRSACEIARVHVVTGDTKVVPRGAVDGLYLTTAGIGQLSPTSPPGPGAIQPDDVLIVSGPIGSHGAAVLCAREKFDFDPPPRSDCAPLVEPIQAILNSGLMPRAMRDATRGGIAAVLHEWVDAADIGTTLIEEQIPVSAPVRAVCELLGLEPVHLANEGTFVLATPACQAEPTIQVLRHFDVTRHAAIVGRIVPRRRTSVSLVRISGREVPLDEPMGAPLPRIC